MGFSERVIDFQSLERGRLRFWKGFVRRHPSRRILGPQKIVSVSEAAIGQREARVFFNCLLKVLDGLLHTTFSPLVPIKPPL